MRVELLAEEQEAGEGGCGRVQVSGSSAKAIWRLTTSAVIAARPLHTIAGQRTLLASAASASAPLAAVLGAIGTAGEFRHGTATPTFLAAPRRARVVTAKVATFAATGAGYAAACLLVAVIIAWPWLAADGIPLELTHPDNLATMAGVIGAAATFGAIGVGLGALLRDQVATIVGLLIYLFVVEPILAGVGSLQAVSNYLPGPARNALTGTALTTRTFLEPWQGAAVLAGYATVLAVAGAATVSRRDVP